MKTSATYLKIPVSMVILTSLLLASTALAQVSTTGRTYVNRDPQQCQVIRYSCDNGQVAFYDDNGCGCETQIFSVPAPVPKPAPKPVFSETSVTDKEPVISEPVSTPTPVNQDIREDLVFTTTHDKGTRDDTMMTEDHKHMMAEDTTKEDDSMMKAKDESTEAIMADDSPITTYKMNVAEIAAFRLTTKMRRLENILARLDTSIAAATTTDGTIAAAQAKQSHQQLDQAGEAIGLVHSYLDETTLQQRADDNYRTFENLVRNAHEQLVDAHLLMYQSAQALKVAMGTLTEAQARERFNDIVHRAFNPPATEVPVEPS